MKPWKCTLRFLRTATLSQNRSINMVLPDPTAEQQGYRGRGCGGGVSGCREAGLAVPPTYRTPQVNAFDFSLHRGASPEHLMGGGGGAWSVHELVLYVTMPSSPPPPPPLPTHLLVPSGKAARAGTPSACAGVSAECPPLSTGGRRHRGLQRRQAGHIPQSVLPWGETGSSGHLEVGMMSHPGQQSLCSKHVRRAPGHLWRRESVACLATALRL